MFVHSVYMVLKVVTSAFFVFFCFVNDLISLIIVEKMVLVLAEKRRAVSLYVFGISEMMAKSF